MNVRHCIYSVFLCENVLKTNLFQKNASSFKIHFGEEIINFMCLFMLSAEGKIQWQGVCECCKCCHFPNLILLTWTVKFRSSVSTYCASVLPVFQTYLSCIAITHCSTIYGTESKHEMF